MLSAFNASASRFGRLQITCWLCDLQAAIVCRYCKLRACYNVGILLNPKCLGIGDGWEDWTPAINSTSVHAMSFGPWM